MKFEFKKHLNKVFCVSDLHLEFYKGDIPHAELFPKPDHDALLVLAGDIDIWKYGGKLKPNTPMVGLLDKLSTDYGAVAYIAGNHEFYRGSAGDYFERKMRGYIDNLNLENVFFLNNDELILNDGLHRLLGTTLWTDMGKNDPLFESKVARFNGHKSSLNDLNMIRYSDDGKKFTRLSVRHIQMMHRKALDFLSEAFSDEFEGKTLVATHHLPTRRFVDDEYKFSALAPAYVSDLDEMMCDADVWMYGHSHQSFEIYDDKTDTLVFTNAAGYKGHRVQNFDPNRAIKI